MFVSASTRCFAEMDFWQALRQIADLEFDKVEIWMDEEGSLKPSVVLSNIDQFVSQLRDQTRLSPVAFTLAQDVSNEHFIELCKLCKVLRVTQVNIPSDVLGTPFNSEIDRLKSLTKTAAVEGVRVAIRMERGRLSEDAHTAVELCQAVKGLGVAFDPSYYLGDIHEQVLALVGPHCYHVHLRDSTEKEFQVQVGLGTIDYSRIITVLERHHYDRALSVELMPNRVAQDQRPVGIAEITHAVGLTPVRTITAHCKRMTLERSTN